MDEILKQLYQDVILDHGTKPRNHFAMKDATNYAEGYNHLCGDQINLFLKLSKHNNIDNISFTGRGCAISQASASLLTEEIKGLDTISALELNNIFCKLLALNNEENNIEHNSNFDDKLEHLKVFEGVKEFPSRVKCATLAWHALKAAIKNNEIEKITKQ